MKKRIDHILRVLESAGSRTITVFGDYCLDKYLYIDPACDEPSVETGLAAYQVDSKRVYPGAGGTVTNNLRSLGAKVRCIGLAGTDGEGYELIKGLERIGADTGWMVRSDRVMTSTYIKPMRKAQNGTYVEMNRLDIRNFNQTPKDLENQLLANLKEALDDSQGVMALEQFVEHNCSSVTDRVREELSALAKRYPEKIFYADSRRAAASYHNVIIKCNQFELPGIPKDGTQDEASILARGQALAVERCGAVVVTMGAGGAFVFEGRTVTHIPSFPVEGPLDIVGAGDATNAGVILGLTLGLTLPEAVLLGGCVSSITIQQIGVTGTATAQQVAQRLMQFQKNLGNDDLAFEAASR